MSKPRRPAGHNASRRLSAYGLADQAARRALAEDAAAAADLASPGLPAAELLELWRATLHRVVDDAADSEALRHPSADRLILRVARYAELYQALKARTGDTR
jgi:hypothetical protein